MGPAASTVQRGGYRPKPSLCSRQHGSSDLKVTFSLRQYYVYIMSSYRGTLYVGVTNNLIRRAQEHRDHRADGFTAKYNVTRLIYFEETPDVRSAIAREKQIKGWRRSRKVDLIESTNPHWVDLFEELEQA